MTPSPQDPNVPVPTGSPRPPRRRTRAYKSREERRQAIVDATIAIIAEQGLVAWKTAELARRVGVSEPTLFRHFTSKAEILTEAVRRETQAVRELVRAYEGEGTGLDRAVGLVHAILSYFVATGGGPIVIVTGQLIRVSPQIRQDILGTVQLVHARLTELFRDGLASEAASPANQPTDLADMAIAVIQSSALRWVMSERRFPIRERADAMLALIRRAAGGGGGREGADGREVES